MAEFANAETSLALELRTKRLAPEDARRIAAQIGITVGEAHRDGRAHGNLTLECVVIQARTPVQAVVRGFDGDSATSAYLDYLSPERRAGGPPSVAADIYAFGKILQAVKNGTSWKDENVGAWDTTIQRCLNSAPERRFNSMRSVLHRLGLGEETVSRGSNEPVSDSLGRWGDFQLLQRLGAGAFGEVYRAWDPILEREVALKLLLPRGLDAEQEFATIVSEARAIARVRHPNIVPVYGVDRRDSRVGFWSEFVRGQTLAILVATEGKLTSTEVAHIGIAVCDALTAVHHVGLLHRDIKASNVMRSEDGQVLLMDFGLSQEVENVKGVAGTPDYMAPEVLAGNPATAQSDIYAVGVLLHFLCTGRHPRLGATNDSSKSATDHTTSAMASVIERATHPDTQQRYESAAKLRLALIATLTSEKPGQEKNVFWKGRRFSFAFVAAVVLVLAAVPFLLPRLRHRAQALGPGATPAAYQSFIAAEGMLLRYDKPGNTEKAIQLYEKTLEQSPNFALAEAGLARADWRMYLNTGDTKWVKGASDASAGAAAMNPNLAPVQMTLGTIHVEQGQASLGMQELEQAKQLDPRNADARAALGEAYREAGRIPDATKELETAMDLASEDWRWPYLLGALELDAGDFAAAESHLKASLEKTPDNARVFYDLGLVYRKQNRLQVAQQALEQAMRLDPRVNFMMALGTVYVLEGKYPEAIDLYKRAAEKQPDDWDVWGHLACAELWTGKDVSERKKHFEKAIELGKRDMKTTPDDPYLLSQLGSYFAYLQDAKQALPLVRKSLVVGADSPDVLETAAESYDALGQREEALHLLAKALQLGFSAEYVKKTPALRELRGDPRAPAAIRENPADARKDEV